MSDIIQISDFQGTEYFLPAQKKGNYQTYLDKYEKKYLVDLLGAELYGLFIADLVGGVPVTSRFLDIYNPFELDDSCSVRKSEGMKLAVIQYVYFYAVRDLNPKKTPTGVVMNSNENSGDPVYGGYNIVEAYNESVSNAHEIQWFICDNMSDYPEENMQQFRFTSGI
jgi:hypothetical protein